MKTANKGVLNKTTWKANVSGQDREKLIAAVACRKAEERGFKNFSPELDPLKDLAEAEIEVREFLSDN